MTVIGSCAYPPCLHAVWAMHAVYCNPTKCAMLEDPDPPATQKVSSGCIGEKEEELEERLLLVVEEGGREPSAIGGGCDGDNASG